MLRKEVVLELLTKTKFVMVFLKFAYEVGCIISVKLYVMAHN